MPSGLPYQSPFLEGLRQGRGGYTPRLDGPGPEEVLIEKGIDRSGRDPVRALEILTDGGAKMGFMGSPDAQFIEQAHMNSRDPMDARGQIDRAFPNLRMLDALDAQAGAKTSTRLRHQPAEEAAEDFESEAAANRAFLPGAQRLRGQVRGDALQDLYERYGRPAEIGAAADIDAASIAGESRIQSAIQGQRERNRFQNPTRDRVLDGLSRAIQTQLETGSGELNPAQLSEIVRYLTQTGSAFE